MIEWICDDSFTYVCWLQESELKEQLEGRQSTANTEVESLKSQLQQMTVTMETQQQRYAHAHHGDKEVHAPGHTHEE